MTNNNLAEPCLRYVPFAMFFLLSPRHVSPVVGKDFKYVVDLPEQPVFQLGLTIKWDVQSGLDS